MDMLRLADSGPEVHAPPQERQARNGGDPHTKRMFRWRNQVRADGELTPFTFCVADALIERIHSRTGYADVTQAALVRLIGRATSRGVQKALQRLAARGHLHIEDRSKLGKQNRYVPIIREEEEGTNGGSYPAEGGYERRFVGGTNGGSGEVRTAVRTRPAPLTNSYSPLKDSRAVAGATRTDQNEAFEEFWKAYPKRAGANPKKPAREKFFQLVKSGVDPAAIIEGARKCAVADSPKIGTEYIPQAIKWLKDQRWEDYLARPNNAEERDALLAEHQRQCLMRTGVADAA
jgi:hypothetical protein